MQHQCDEGVSRGCAADEAPPYSGYAGERGEEEGEEEVHYLVVGGEEVCCERSVFRVSNDHD